MLGSNLKNRWASVQFCLGLTIVFVLLGMTATTIGLFLNEYIYIFRIVCGLLVIVLGLQSLKVINIGFLNKTYQLTSSETNRFQPLIIGMTFGFTFSPCVGPILGTILMVAANATTVWYGAWLLFLYSLGLSIPFIVAAEFTHTFSFIKTFLLKHMETIEFVSGMFIVLIGIAIAIGSISI